MRTRSMKRSSCARNQFLHAWTLFITNFLSRTDSHPPGLSLGNGRKLGPVRGGGNGAGERVVHNLAETVCLANSRVPCREAAQEISQLRSGWLRKGNVFRPERTVEQFALQCPFRTKTNGTLFQTLRVWLISERPFGRGRIVIREIDSPQRCCALLSGAIFKNLLGNVDTN